MVRASSVCTCACVSSFFTHMHFISCVHACVEQVVKSGAGRQGEDKEGSQTVARRQQAQACSHYKYGKQQGNGS